MTWTSPKSPPYIVGEYFTVNDWNAYLGANGNVAYLKDEFSNSHYDNYVYLANTSVTNNTTTVMNIVGSTSFITVPNSLYESSGLYYIYANVKGNNAITAASSRRGITIQSQIGAGAWTTIDTDTSLTSPNTAENDTYITISSYQRLVNGEKIRIQFYQQTGSNGNYQLHLLCRRLSK